MPPGEEMFKYHGYSGPCPPKADDAVNDLAKPDQEASNG
jgi:hypothetical protein